MDYFPKQLKLMIEFYQILHEMTDSWKDKNTGMEDVKIIFHLLGIAGELSHHYGSRDFWESKVILSNFKNNLKYLINEIKNGVESLKKNFSEIYNLSKLEEFQEKLSKELEKLKKES